MPPLIPAESESRESFISRFMADDVMAREFPDRDQRLGACFTQWRKNDKLARPSHYVAELSDGDVMIYDLELFVGYVPGFDSPDDKRFSKYNSERVDFVIDRTQQVQQAGRNPRLILRHNGTDNPRKESLGEIVKMRRDEIIGGPGVLGNVRMSKDDFKEYIESNRYPGRSAEIWDDGEMSAVALLGSETPARPVCDTRFTRDGDRELFTRSFELSEPSTFSIEPTSTLHGPGLGNSAVHGSTTMTDEEKDKQEQMARLTKLEKENEDLREQNAKLKAQVDDDDKKCEVEKNTREQFQRQASELGSQVDQMRKQIGDLQSENRVEKYSRELDRMFAEGFSVGTVDNTGKMDDRRKELLDRIVVAANPDAEVAHYRKFLAPSANPFNVVVSQEGLTTASNFSRQAFTEDQVKFGMEKLWQDFEKSGQKDFEAFQKNARALTPNVS